MWAVFGDRFGHEAPLSLYWKYAEIVTPHQDKHFKDDEVTALVRGTKNRIHTISRAEPARSPHSREWLDYTCRTACSSVGCGFLGDVIRQGLYQEYLAKRGVIDALSQEYQQL